MDTFATTLLAWFHQHGRKELPWQHPRSAYRVWLSEVMLQQTQVSTVIPYFEAFVARFPSVVQLADAHEDEVLSMWAGLGYYARARNLHAAAQRVRDQFGGEFPSEQEQLESLPGVGRSTAGAIRAQAFAQPGVILDANVKRVLARFHALIGPINTAAVEAELWHLAETHTPYETKPQSLQADYAQAIMDLGATICGRTPKCGLCPMQDSCEAYAAGLQAALPNKKRKAKQTKPKKLALLTLQFDEQGMLLLEKRPGSGIWGGLLCPPMQYVEQLDEPGEMSDGSYALPIRTHSFSHFDLEFQAVLVAQQNTLGGDKLNSVEDEGRHYKHRLGDKPAGGFPAPITKLLNELYETSTWQEWFFAANSKNS